MYTEIKTFQKACTVLNIDSKLPVVTGLPKKHWSAIVAHYKLVIITQAINQGWKPNWSDSNESKYYPWFEVKADKKRPSGFGLSYYGYDYWTATTTVGSRLCFKDRERAKFAATQFKKLYEQYFLLK